MRDFLTRSIMSYTTLPPEEDPTLQANFYYWLYKITREALDNPKHPLHDMGHIWNRWAYAELSEGDRKKYNFDYTTLSDDNKERIIHYLNTDERKNELKKFPSFITTIDFSNTVWEEKANFDRFIFPQKSDFSFTTFIQNADFSFTTFTQDANFNRIIFTENAIFSSVIFAQKSDFQYAKFTQYVNFDGTTFTQNTNFSNTEFIQDADFLNTTFMQYAHFENTIFKKNSNFNGIIFTQNANFAFTTFTQEANFSNVTFTQEANFGDTTFEKNANFENTKFIENVFFTKAKFIKNVTFEKAIFLGNIVRFIKCRFPVINNDNRFSFYHTIFEKEVGFSESVFSILPDMTGTDFRCGMNLDKVSFAPNRKISYKTDKDITHDSNRHCEEARRADVAICLKNSIKQCFKYIKTGLPRLFYKSLAMTNVLSHCYKSLMCHTSREKILGGLSCDDAEITWHTLQTEMEKSGYHDKALEYFGYELDAKYFNSNTGRTFKVILRGYKILSDYGRNILRPFAWWVVLIFLSFALHYFVVSDIPLSLQLSLRGAMPFVADQTTFYERMFADPTALEECKQTSDYQENVMYYVNLPCYENNTHNILNTQKNPPKEPIPFDNYLELKLLILHGLHTLLSLILIFLCGLGVRNRLRLK